jgi:hypothetical protein
MALRNILRLNFTTKLKQCSPFISSVFNRNFTVLSHKNEVLVEKNYANFFAIRTKYDKSSKSKAASKEDDDEVSESMPLLPRDN